MASKEQVVNDILQELGKSSSELRERLFQLAGEITVDLLNENDGRFHGLSGTETISIVKGVRRYRLPAKFKTPKKVFCEVDSNGEILANCYVQQKATIRRKIGEGKILAYRLCYIDYTKETTGPASYLILAASPPANTIYEFEYYRKATINDASCIENESILKTGIRGRLDPHTNPNQRTDLVVYYRMKEGFREPIESMGEINTDLPGLTEERNALMNKIAKGL